MGNMQTEKYYSDIREWGSTLYKALFSDRHNNPRVVDDWISETSEEYLSVDYDYERFPNLIWGMQEVGLIKFFDRNKIDIEYINRNDLDKWIAELSTKTRLKDKDALALLLRLKESFKKDLDGKREEWAYLRASDDFDCCFGEVDSDNDEQVAEFFGITAKVTAVRDYRGYEHDLSEVCFCPYCEEAMAQENQEEIQKDIDPDEKYSEGMFYCEACGGTYSKGNSRFIEVNKHIPEAKLVAWRV